MLGTSDRLVITPGKIHFESASRQTLDVNGKRMFTRPHILIAPGILQRFCTWLQLAYQERDPIAQLEYQLDAATNTSIIRYLRGGFVFPEYPSIFVVRYDELVTDSRPTPPAETCLNAHGVAAIVWLMEAYSSGKTATTRMTNDATRTWEWALPQPKPPEAPDPSKATKQFFPNPLFAKRN